MPRKLSRSRRRYHSANYVGAALLLLLVGWIVWANAVSVRRVDVTDSFAVKIEQPYFSWFSSPTIESVQPGIAEVSSRATVYSVDLTRPATVSFKVVLSGDFVNSWVPLFEGEPPLFVRGTIEVSVPQEAALRMFREKQDGEIAALLLAPLKNGLAKHRKEASNLGVYAEVAFASVKEALSQSLDITARALVIEAAEKAEGSTNEGASGLVHQLSLMNHVPTGVVVQSISWVVGILLLLIATHQLWPPGFKALSGLPVILPVLLINLIGASVDSPWDFGGDGIDSLGGGGGIDIDVDIG